MPEARLAEDFLDHLMIYRTTVRRQQTEPQAAAELAQLAADLQNLVGRNPPGPAATGERQKTGEAIRLRIVVIGTAALHYLVTFCAPRDSRIHR